MRFLIEWNQADNSVWYEIRPNHRVARLGYPMVPPNGKTLRPEFSSSMLRAVRSDDEVRAVQYSPGITAMSAAN